MAEATTTSAASPWPASGYHRAANEPRPISTAQKDVRFGLASERVRPPTGRHDTGPRVMEGEMKEQRCPLTVGHPHHQGAHAVRPQRVPLG
jgi:hypothetical protein